MRRLGHTRLKRVAVVRLWFSEWFPVRQWSPDNHHPTRSGNTRCSGFISTYLALLSADLQVSYDFFCAKEKEMQDKWQTNEAVKYDIVLFDICDIIFSAQI